MLHDLERWSQEHNAELKRRQEVAEVRKAWQRKWPNACQKCHGWGVHTWSENQSPLGSGRNWPMEMAEPCSCVEEGTCARCGLGNALDLDTGEGPCPTCNWNYDDGEPS